MRRMRSRNTRLKDHPNRVYSEEARRHQGKLSPKDSHGSSRHRAYHYLYEDLMN
jgi:hypothetical protein